MRQELADKLLASVMGWSPLEVAQYRPELDAIARLKYDGYEQFKPGLRFIESLAAWLYQFASEDRALAFDYIRSNLIYISQSELHYLISLVYPTIIRSIVLENSAKELRQHKYCVSAISNSSTFRRLLRQCLFVGLSDGARLDTLRRASPQISHEQISQDYQIDEKKIAAMHEELRKDLAEFKKDDQNDQDNPDDRFRFLFLIDDFTASGKSYFRTKDDGSYTGKVYKAINSVLDTNDLGGIFDLSNLEVHIIIYIAFQTGYDKLYREITEWIQNHKLNLGLNIHPVHVIPRANSLKETPNPKFDSLLAKHFDPAVLTDSYKKGLHSSPHLGFDECGLALVMYHNTPNNSLPLLWYDDGPGKHGLFPRVNRHRK